MAYLGDSTIPPILQGAQSQSTYVPPSAPSVPLILQGGGTYNYPEIFAASAGSPTYTPVSRAKKDLNALALTVIAATIFIGLGVGGRGRYTW